MPRGQGPEASEDMERRQGGGFGPELGGFCVCPNCGQKVPCKFGISCSELRCPNCGNVMMRE